MIGVRLPATCYLTVSGAPTSVHNSHKHEMLNFYGIGDDSPGTHLRKSRPLFLSFSRIPCPRRWHYGINPDSYHRVDF